MPFPISFNDEYVIKPCKTLHGHSPKGLVKFLENMSLEEIPDENLVLILPIDMLNEATPYMEQFKLIKRVIFATPKKWIAEKSYMRSSVTWEWTLTKVYDWNSIIPHTSLRDAVNAIYREKIFQYAEKMPYDEAVDFAEHKAINLTTDEIIKETIRKPIEVKTKTVWNWE
jgi:hypothetical protein